MPSHTPWNAEQVLDAYFLETRAKLLEIAATLDRIDRAGSPSPGNPRLAFIRNSLSVLQSNSPNRAEEIQTLYSLQ